MSVVNELRLATRSSPISSRCSRRSTVTDIGRPSQLGFILGLKVNPHSNWPNGQSPRRVSSGWSANSIVDLDGGGRSLLARRGHILLGGRILNSYQVSTKSPRKFKFNSPNV